MGKYALMTDICCDLPAKLADELEITAVPLTLSIGDKEYHNYLDEREISVAEFYNLLRSGKDCKTSAVNVTAFISYMEPIVSSGKDLLYIAFSSALSNTCNAAGIAASELSEKYPERKIYVVDSLSASMGQGLLVFLTAKERLKGRTIDEVRKFAEDLRLNICHWFTVEDLYHLHRGGRVSKTSAVVGTMLNIKPILHVDNEGRLINVSKTRGTKNAIRALFEKMERTVTNPEEQTILISHSDAIEKAEELAEMIRKKWSVKDIIINTIGPTIGIHTGPGTLSLFFQGRER